MKIQRIALYIFLLFCLFCTTISYSQTKQTTEIICNNVADFDGMMQTFIAYDNYIDTDNYGVITTVLRNSTTKPKWTHQYNYRIVRKNDTVIIKPYWTMGITIDLGSVEAPAQLEKWHYSDRKNINNYIYQETMQVLKSAGVQDISFN